MGSVIFCNIAWMKRYQGITEDDVPKDDGSRKGEAKAVMEAVNFFSYRGMCYGYVQQKGSRLYPERLDKAAAGADVLDDVTVVWVADGKEGRRIVGWYENAGMYRNVQTFEDGSRYYFAAKATDAYLIPVRKRDFPVPLASKEGKGKGMGQAGVWYADTVYAKEKYVPRVLEYLKKMKSDCRIAGFTKEEINQAADVSGVNIDNLIALAAAASDNGEQLYAVQLCNRALKSELVPGGFLRVFRAIGLEMMSCYDEAIEAYKDALEHFTQDEIEQKLDIDARFKLSRIYRLTGQNQPAMKVEEDIFDYFRQTNDTSGMADSLLEQMAISREEKDFEGMKKLLASFDELGTEHRADEAARYRSLLDRQEV